MVKTVVKDEFFLRKPSDPATAEDLPVAQEK